MILSVISFMREKIEQLKTEGLKNFEIANLLGISQSTVSYHLNIDYRKRHYDNLKIRRINFKEQSINQKGGKCFLCGYNKCIAALEFHHLNPLQKDPNIVASNMALTKQPIHILKSELDKCVLLCANCHREVHAGLSTIKQS